MYCVTVLFRIHPEHIQRFTQRMRQQAADSLAKEAGCERFDVWSDPARPAEIYLYELYSDRAAFAAHLESAHYKDFDALAAAWVAEKQVATWETQL